MIFEIKSDLPIETQRKIDAIEAIPSAQRTTNQAAFLTSLAPYLTNLIISVGADGLITAASGLTVPTGYSGFRKGATFIKTDASTKGTYENVGTSTSAVWDLLGGIDTADLVDGSVTEAKLATSISFEGKAISFGDVTPVNAVAASAVLTSDNTEVANKATVTIGTTVYRIIDTPEAINDVKRHGTTADTTLANLVAAINGSGTPGTEYFEGTVAHTDVTASEVASHAITLTAKVKGVAGNDIAKDETDSHLDFDGDGEVFTGGVDGTVGVKLQVVADDTNLYICTDANTITGTNWKKLVLQSL